MPSSQLFPEAFLDSGKMKKKNCLQNGKKKSGSIDMQIKSAAWGHGYLAACYSESMATPLN